MSSAAMVTMFEDNFNDGDLAGWTDLATSHEAERVNPPLQRTVCKADTQPRVWLGKKYDYIYSMEREYRGKRYLIVVNVNKVAATDTFTVPDLPNDSVIKMMWENRSLQPKNGVFHDVIPGIGVVVYEY